MRLATATWSGTPPTVVLPLVELPKRSLEDPNSTGLERADDLPPDGPAVDLPQRTPLPQGPQVGDGLADSCPPHEALDPGPRTRPLHVLGDAPRRVGAAGDGRHGLQ